MTEDDGSASSGPSVDAVTGQLATRLGAVGESAGEVMRRNVRGAAGGAETIALLVQADIAGAHRVTSEHPDAPVAAPAAEHARPAGTGAPEPRLATGDPPTPDVSAPDPTGLGAIGDVTGHRPALDSAAAPPAGSEGQAGILPDPGPQPLETGAADLPPVPADPSPTPIDPPPKPADPPPDLADPPPKPAVPSMEPARIVGEDLPVPGTDLAAGHTPWTAGAHGAEPSSGQPPGSTPWSSGSGSSGSGSSMPYLPGMPGGMGSLTPQERPPRGSAPWSRSRAGKDANREGTVFPRPESDGSSSDRSSSTAYPFGRPRD
ncbi:hypothetical protein [Nocardia sp. NBC_00416]|uniref:hypothetical protein n=1 Tax=Nocardia sp. NBC_00416 TaxID=2975991 RepID=UPI002E246E48